MNIFSLPAFQIKDLLQKVPKFLIVNTFNNDLIKRLDGELKAFEKDSQID